MKHDKESIIREIKSWVYTVILPVLVVLVLNLFVCKLAIVSGSSMYPTLHHRDILLVWMLNDKPENGDIVVVNTDEDSVMAGEKIVKRVIATEGQVVDIDFSTGTVFVDGQALDEPYIHSSTTRPEGMKFPLTVDDGCVFVMGDNRLKSMDSRDPLIGLIDEREILGKALFLLWPGKGTDSCPIEFDFFRIGVIE